MKELTIEEKIAEIKNTNTYQDVKNDWFPPYYEKEYYFVSYSHKDYKLVYESLHRLQSGEKRLNLWYDHNLTPGRDWEIEARRYIYDFNCKGVIFFLSENAVLSQSIHKEIEFVKNSGKSYLSINLPCEKIKGHIGEYLAAAQMLELLKQQGYEIENYDEKSAVLNETFNSKITFLRFNQEIEEQIDKILSLKRQPLLNIDKGDRMVTSINDINVLEIKKEDFDYYEDNYYVLNQHGTATRIGPCAFANCHNLEKIELPDILTGIYKYVFYDCKSLKKISLHKNIRIIEAEAFYGCSGLECIMVDGSNNKYSSQDGILYNKERTEIIYVPQAIKGEVTIPQSITSIDRNAFAGCTNLKSIIISNSVKSIGSCAFFRCENLTSIIISDGVTSIGDYAFDGCTKLIQTQGGVQYVDKWVVDCDTSLIVVDLRTDTKGIANSAFRNCESLESIIIPTGVTSIGSGVFFNCTSLTSITIPNGVISIGEGAFSDCTGLTSITIPDSVTSIGDDAFFGCTSLESITIPDRVTSIGSSAFSHCTSLESITIPDRITSIGKGAFYGCTSLKDIFYKGTIKQWGSIYKDDYWDLCTPNYTVHCTDGDLKKGEF